MKIPGWHWGHFGGAAAVLLMILLAAGAMQMSAARDASSSESAVDAARQMLARQDYDAALAELDRVLDEQPDNGRARFLKGLTLARSGDNDDALALFERLCKDFPDMADAWNNLGVLRAREGRLDSARAALTKATQIDPEHIAAQQNLGDVYVALARQAYVDVSALAPANATAKSKSQELAALMQSAVAANADQAVAGAQAADTGPDADDSAAARERQTSTDSATANAPVAPAVVAGDTSAGTTDRDAAAAPGAERTPEAEIRAALQRWAEAWSAQDLDTYFAAYSDDFEPADELTLQQWRALRVRRITGPERIRVQLSQIEISLDDDDRAVAHFEQDYESDRYQDDVRKTITLQRGPAGWLIRSET